MVGPVLPLIRDPFLVFQQIQLVSQKFPGVPIVDVSVDGGPAAERLLLAASASDALQNRGPLRARVSSGSHRVCGHRSAVKSPEAGPGTEHQREGGRQCRRGASSMRTAWHVRLH